MRDRSKFSPFAPTKIFRSYAKEKVTKKSIIDEIDLKNAKKAIYSYAKNKDSPSRPKNGILLTENGILLTENGNLLTENELNSNSGYLMPDKKNITVKSMGTFGVNAVGKKPIDQKKELLSQDGDKEAVAHQNFNKKKGLVSFNKLRYL